MYVVLRITADQPSFNIDINSWKISSSITLADPEFHRTQRVDMLLGAEVFYDLMGCKRIEIGEGLPSLFETKIGWIVAGKIVTNKKGSFCLNILGQPFNEDDTTDRVLEKF